MVKYNSLSRKIQDRIINDRKNGYVNEYAFRDEDVLRRNIEHDRANIWRPAFVRDIEKIMHIPLYNRYSDKTQVFSLYKNDDITRRALHVQLVSRIARNIGMALGLNVDLIEAVSLGHDIGHTPFGHAGERILSELYYERTGRYFNHNIHSARVLDKVFPLNLSLQTLDGIICHNGEIGLKEYRPVPYNDFAEFDAKMNMCYEEKGAVKKLVPATLEACVMRVSDIIAYLGKDRQDAIRLGMFEDDRVFEDGEIGTTNAQIINNMIVNIIENSYGKPCLQMDESYYNAFTKLKAENQDMIYRNEKLDKVYNLQIRPMMSQIYEAALKDVREHNVNSYVYKHHIEYVNNSTRYYSHTDYAENEPDDIVVDYIASMTDDYFIDLHRYLFPKSEYSVEYTGYFG